MEKTFNDPIHGHIQLSALAVKIIDTPEFQRLRDVSQLGGVYFVYPGASSNRFEHSLGVAHLARTFCRVLKQQQPTHLKTELRITEQDELCVEIAGLCHDLGHGPYSHMFESRFLKAMRPGNEFKHEHASVRIFELLIEENNLVRDFEVAGLDIHDVHFIKELILGDSGSAGELAWKGRGEKNFLYEIVANKRNNIDVDKFDYLARDCHHLGIAKSFDSSRLMRFARVLRIEDRGGTQKLSICYHVKQAFDVYELFHTRYSLHKRAYQHRVAAAVELMLNDVLIAADEHFRIPGKGGIPRRLSECIDDMHAFCKLTDYIFRVIENSFEPELHNARKILSRLRKRQLYRLVDQVLLPPTTQDGLEPNLPSNATEASVHAELVQYISSTSPVPGVAQVPATDLIVLVVEMNYGQKHENPVLHTQFYHPMAHARTSLAPKNTNSSDAPPFRFDLLTPREDTISDQDYDIGIVNTSQISLLVPNTFQERYLRVYCKEDSQWAACKRAFDRWCGTRSLSSQQITSTPKRRRTS